MLAAEALKSFKPFKSKAEAKRNIVSAIESVAERLGNTEAVCRKCYVNPAVIDCYLDGSLNKNLQTKAKSSFTAEDEIMAFLYKQAKKEGNN